MRLKRPLFHRSEESRSFDNRPSWNIYGYARYPKVNSAHSFWALLLLYILMMKAMVGNFPTLTNVVLTYASNLMAESLDVLSISAVALTLAIFAANTMRRKRSVPKSFHAHESFPAKRVKGRLVKSQHSPVLKQCPSCAQQLPLSALMCDTCDYNFLAERPGRRQVLLPPPNHSRNVTA